MSLDARQTWGSWETTSSLGKKTKKHEVTKVIISALFLFYISVVRISNVPEGQEVHAHRGDLVCQTHPESKRVGEMGMK